LIYWERINQGNYTIGEFARLLAVSPRTIDFYTRQGLLHPAQPARGHGYRRYTQEDRRRVSLIKQLQANKFSLQEIRQVLDSSSRKDVSSAVEAMEKMALDLKRLQSLVKNTRSSAFILNQSAIGALATEALQRATALCSVLVTLLQDLPSM
jgi:DNA-binding transcriptional MerR regulator